MCTEFRPIFPFIDNFDLVFGKSNTIISIWLLQIYKCEHCQGNLLSSVSVGIWTLHHSPVLIKISADKSNQGNIYTIGGNYIWFATECKELICMLDPLLYTHLLLSGVCSEPCKGGGGGGGVRGTADLDYPSEPCHRNEAVGFSGPGWPCGWG